MFLACVTMTVVLVLAMCLGYVHPLKWVAADWFALGIMLWICSRWIYLESKAARKPSFRPDCLMRQGADPCRVELANGPSDDERGFYARFRRPDDAARFVAMHNAAIAAERARRQS